jgi:hypothetical protein
LNKTRAFIGVPLFDASLHCHVSFLEGIERPLHAALSSQRTLSTLTGIPCFNIACSHSR